VRNAKELFASLSLLSDAEFVPGGTLIFLDEAQVSKEIVTAIKFLVEKNDFDFILSGSMLGTELKDIHSVPVGYLDTITMYPLDFEEFARSRGIRDTHREQLRDCFLARKPLPGLLHDPVAVFVLRILDCGWNACGCQRFQ
jgi:predicted AAA+ superfamily ATPase